MRKARLGGLHLDLPLADVLQILGGTNDHVNDRAHEREQRRGGRATDEHRIGDPAAGVGVGPIDERQPNHDEEQDDQIRREIEPAALDAEDGEGEHLRTRV